MRIDQGRSWRLSALTLALVALAWATTGCAPEEEAGASGKQEVKPMAVEIQEVTTQRFVQTFEFPGVAEPIETRRIAAEAAGRILKAPFEEGDRVKKGDLMLRVDAKNSRAQINLLKSQVSAARREYDRIKQLASEGLATPQQLDQVTSQLEQAQLSLKQARIGKDMTVVRSPFTGVVAMTFARQGEFTSPGQPIAELYDSSTIKLEVTVPESAVRYISVGDEVEVLFTASGESFNGKVAKRGVRVAQPTQTFPIEVHIPNEEGEILPGMRARVIIPKLTLEDAVVVPRDALLEGVFQREAMVLEGLSGDVGKASLRVVEIGEARGNEIVIKKGLAAGDKLIVAGHRNVVDGTLVRVVREHPARKVAEVTPPSDEPAAAKQ